MKKTIPGLLILALCLPVGTGAQNKVIDSIRQVLGGYTAINKQYTSDTGYLNTLNELAFRYMYIEPDSVLTMGRQVVLFTEKARYWRGRAEALKNMGLAHNVRGNYDSALLFYNQALQIATDKGLISTTGKIRHNMGNTYSSLGKYPDALENYFNALSMREKSGEKLGIASSIIGIGAVYSYQGKWEQALQYSQKGLALSREINYKSGMEVSSANIGEIYYRQKKFDQAREALTQSLGIVSETGNGETKAFIYYILGSIFGEQQKYPEAVAAFRESRQAADEVGSQEYQARSLIGLARICLATGKKDSALFYAEQGTGIANRIRYNEIIRDGNEALSAIYESAGEGMKALAFHKLFKTFADSINNLESEQRSGALLAEYEYSKKEILLKADYDRKHARQNWIIFSAFAALFSAMVVSWLIYRSRQKEKKVNALLKKQRDEINQQRSNLETTLGQLQATQAQLIQSEKMASLGELTAGIAHEIQNPLNFVNNFSEVNKELIGEMRQELTSGNTEGAGLISRDIEDNQDKIIFHGQRADAIVKSMLQHSRTSSGRKESVDVNALCEEYLRLAFHAFHSGKGHEQVKDFRVTLHTDFDPSVGRGDLIPQDIGRVLLNLYNNAFYAVHERAKSEGSAYQPMVSVKTHRQEGLIHISISDNGPGIPENIREKIFQPFFTTKPTGQGTGLGLSLSYDIIKAHGGALQIESTQGNGASFRILLPLPS